MWRGSNDELWTSVVTNVYNLRITDYRWHMTVNMLKII